MIRVTVVKAGRSPASSPIQVSAQHQQAKPQAVKPQPKVQEPVSPVKKAARYGCGGWRLCLDNFGCACGVLISLYRFCSRLCGGLLRSFWNVSHSLHTPLMSVTNLQSQGSLLWARCCKSDKWRRCHVLIIYAVLIASINIFGGFYRDQTYA
ncbi:proton-translocating transhydrogenase family protein [Vibrio lentus]|nr:proton-translocating transhydrogenase family protein [Vibrio lentus]